MRRIAPTTIKGKKGQQLNQREASMINGLCLNGLLVFNVVQKNGGVTLEYNTDGLVPLADFLRMNVMNKRLFAVLLRSVVRTLHGIEENRFSKGLVEWSISYTYVDPTSWHVYLTYVPIQPYETHGNLKSFLLELIAACSFETNDGAEYVRILEGEVKTGVSYTATMLEDYCNKLSEQFASASQKKVQQLPCPFCSAKLNADEDTCPFCGAQVRKSTQRRKSNASSVIIDAAEPALVEGMWQGDCVANSDGNRKTQINEALAVNENENGVVTVFRKALNGSHIVWLEDIETKRKIQINQWPFRLGRMEGIADYRLYNSAISRKHADLLKENGKYYIFDLGSTNGTYLNGKRLQPGVKEELRNGACIQLAETKLIFHID